MISHILWTLIAIQIALGAFDTIYHHEFTERLPWRVSQRHELQLHAVRNLIYAVLFIAIGWSEPHGYLAMLAIVVLTVEVVITLMDFVEEDLTRRLPASERINHTLLALNYGAILVLLVPILLDWANDATALRPAYHGLWSMMVTAAAFGVGLFGLRDWFASRRLARGANGQAETLTTALAVRHAVLVTGATGFIGRRLTEALAAGGHEAIVLTRDPRKAEMLRPPFRLITSLDQISDGTRIDAIVSLAGEPIAEGLWTRRRRRDILQSRFEVTMDVIRLIARLDRRPAVLINGSAVGWYGLRQDEELTESSDGRSCFTHLVCDTWEQAAVRAEEFGVRTVRLRIGLVLGTDGGMLARLLTPFWFGLGGRIGTGTQWMSWIERDDLVRLIAHVIATPALAGAINATAPEPVRNRDFTAQLACALHRPALLRIPGRLLHRLLGDFADELLLSGQRVLPEKAQASGFVFRHPMLRGALAAMLGSTRQARREPAPRRLSPHASH
jgi:uncharacterized protein (TIGR01777 family)